MIAEGRRGHSALCLCRTFVLPFEGPRQEVECRVSPVLRTVVLASWLFAFGVVSAADERSKTGPSDAPLAARIDAALARAAGFLVARQDNDGAWRSTVYGACKDGPSLTPHVISCLYFLPQGGPQARAAFEKGTEYLVGLVGPDGRVGDDLELIYPVYTAAEASRMIRKAVDSPRYRRAAAAWLAVLRRHQLNESLGWRESDLEYGGWSFAPRPPRKPAAGRERGAWDWSNLSATLYGLAAMRSERVPASDPSYRQILLFVQRCQNYSEDPAKGDPRFDDGGFFFSPADVLLNKAGVAGRDALGRQRYRSYGSMTADGLRAMLTCGLPPAHPRVRAARAWLEKNLDLTRNPGVFERQNESLRDAVYYYYCWGLAHAMLHLRVRTVETPRGPVDWPVELTRIMLDKQRPNGSWVNAWTEGREDDPLVATSFAASVLAIGRHVLSGGQTPAACPTPAQGATPTK